MGKTRLIAGTGGSFGADLARDYLLRGDRVGFVQIEGSTPSLTEEEESNFQILSWNPRSPLSTHNLILDALGIFPEIDEAIIVLAPQGGEAAFHELSSAEIEGFVDTTIKGYAYFIREVLGLFQKQASGILSFVHYSGGTSDLSPLHAAAAGAFRFLAESLFSQYRNEALLIRGFYTHLPEAESFRRYILGFADRPDRTAGKWLKFSGLSSLLSFGRK